jgi:hypothetical protein
MYKLHKLRSSLVIAAFYHGSRMESTWYGICLMAAPAKGSGHIPASPVPVTAKLAQNTNQTKGKKRKTVIRFCIS